MKLDRSIDIKMELQTRVQDLVSSAKCFHLTHSELTDRYLKLFERYPKDLPTHVRSYISGYYSALVDSLYHVHLTHGFEWNGIVYEKWDSMPEDLKEVIRKDCDNVPHGHYWKDTLDKRTNKPFFTPEVKHANTH